MRKRKTLAAVGAMIMLAAGTTVTTVAQAGGGRPAVDPGVCSATAPHRQDLANLIDKYERRQASGKDSGNQLRSVEARLTAGIRKAPNEDVRLALQDLLDEAAAARVAVATDASAKAEVVPVLLDRLASYQGTC